MTTPKPDALGAPVEVRVPASSANLGSGFDALGLALDLHNTVVAEPIASGVEIVMAGEGADYLAPHGGNLVARATMAALGRLAPVARRPPGLRLSCTNGIPTARGLGSSAAAIVAGVAAAHALARPGRQLDRDLVLAIAGAIEGHPDNVAACVRGGATIGWQDHTGTWRGARLEPHPDLRATLLVPSDRAPTAEARAMLPDVVPHADAAHAAGRSALLVHAITKEPDVLLAATEDRLHQQYRAASMPDSAELVRRLRSGGWAAVVSGAGPTVLVLHTRGRDPMDDLERTLGELPPGWRALALDVDRSGVEVTAIDATTRDWQGSPRSHRE